MKLGISARAAAREAMTEWVRLVWVRRAYEIRIGPTGFCFGAGLGKVAGVRRVDEAAFGPHGVIRDTDHPIYRELIGRRQAGTQGVGDDNDDDDDL